uniref:Uncharacterized protein n=1 Tax=Chromera velia CCMP2878 TaxID=1169474 RepID=A0A0G4GEE9_9ALVE|eukprot:Cvel_21515.t1-p1 / transcript=Cvel_21515.t1 / gene=Cvel_21515 / organism=Chromera_velia_CCMP2878 / gene_product=hypothetical protein / transcript_product=hypothetical protein / location=Cvel_scaffold2025:11769-14366(+) / protein_length=866 / sequence_SO=supercontig / SO=protein_coding / is_pseudo=false
MGQPDEGLGLPPLRDPRSPQARAVLGGSAGARLSFAKGDPHPRGVGYACVSLSFSPDGFLLLAAYENGLVDLLNFPELDRALVVEAPFKTPPRRCSLQHPQSTFDSEEDVFASKEGGGDFRARHFVSVAPPAEGPQAEEAPAERRKALFLQGRPQRARDGDTAPCTGTRMGGLRGGGGELFILSQQGVGEVVLYETFPIGSKRAKHVAAEYRVPDMENTTNGMLSLEIADFCPHPSSLYLIAVCNLSPFFVLPHGAASLAEAAESDATPLRWAGMQTLVFELATGTLLCHAACDPSPSGSRLACSALFLNCDPSGTFFFVGAQVIRRGEGGNEVENGGEEAGKAQHVPPIGRPTSEAAGAMAGSAGRLSAENLLNAIESLRREGYAKRETGGGGAFPALLGLGGGGAPQGVGAHWQWADSIPGRFSGNEDRLKGRQGQPINEMNIIKRAEDGLIGGPYPTLLTAISFETGLPAYSLTVDLAPSPPPCPSECLRFLPDDLSTVFSGHADGSLSFWRLPARMLGLIGKTFQYASVDREMFPSCLYELSALEQADAPLPGQFAERLLSLQALTEFWGQTALRAPAWTQWAHKFRIAPPADEEVRSPLCNPSPPNLIRRPDSIGKGSGGREDPLAEARQAFIPPSTGRLAAVSGPLAGANPPRFSVAAGAGTPTTWVSAHAAVKARPPHRTSSVPFAGAVRDPVEADVMEDEEGNSRLVAYAPELVRRYGDRRVDMAAADPIPGCPFDCPQGAERGVRLSSTSLLPSTVIPAERGFLQQKEGRVGLAPRTVRVGGKSPEALGTAALSPRLQLPINANSRPGAAPGFAVKEGLGGMQFEVVERVFGDLDSFERQHIPSDGSDDDPYFEDGV